MAKAKETKTVWLAELDRFGYMLTAVAGTREEAEKIIMKEYSKKYKDINGVSPGKDYYYSYYSDGDRISYYHAALEDIRYTKFEFEKCYWR